MKLKTEPISFEIEVEKLSKEIPKESDQEFKEWLLNKPLFRGIGKHNELFLCTENPKDDIEVSFYIRKIIKVDKDKLPIMKGEDELG
jgi:hypothetical protein